MTTPSTTASPTAPTRRPTLLQRFLAWVDGHRRGILVANLAAQIGIIVTGGLVRLTGSGLGCSTWPQCEPGSFVPVYHPETAFHSAIEFGNRTLTGVVSITAVLVAVALWRMRDRAKVLRVLGFAPIVLVAVQAVVGGITVLVDLHPAIVGSHMFLSLVLVAVSTYLLVRAGEGDAPGRVVVPAPGRALALASGILAVPMLVLGVLTTGAGPHSGDEEVGYRFALDPAHAAKLHGMSVWLYIAVVVAFAVVVLRAVRRVPAEDRLELVRPLHALREVAGVVTLQAVIGYVQYFAGLPIVLVLLHMLGAALTTAVVVRLVLSSRVRPALAPTSPLVADIA
ncbi:heme A synthase [Sanguibacter sp. HDW7]|uniref:COX15/CtaA family protein n=1 Tax=Sanguibacter sp. HDW7 TaxID=2714931 RepID=UPI001F0D1936|nr:COX15/CtaA family protein [Sanguibacter sp. HDW7]